MLAPSAFDLIAALEMYHPRTTLRCQLARCRSPMGNAMGWGWGGHTCGGNPRPLGARACFMSPPKKLSAERPPWMQPKQLRGKGTRNRTGEPSSLSSPSGDDGVPAGTHAGLGRSGPLGLRGCPGAQPRFPSSAGFVPVFLNRHFPWVGSAQADRGRGAVGPPPLLLRGVGHPHFLLTATSTGCRVLSVLTTGPRFRSRPSPGRLPSV